MSSKESNFQQQFSQVAVDNGSGQAISEGGPERSRRLFGRLRKAVGSASEEASLLDDKNALIGTQSNTISGGLSGEDSGTVSDNVDSIKLGRREIIFGGAAIGALSALGLGFAALNKNENNVPSSEEEGEIATSTYQATSTVEKRPTPEATVTQEAVEIPPYPPKYNFGPNGEYFRQFENGFFTGVDEKRATESYIKFGVEWNKDASFEYSREPIKGLEVVDQQGIEAALYISDALWDRKKGAATVEDFDQIKSEYDALVAEGKAPLSKIRGLVFIDEPPVGFYTNQAQGYSKYTEEETGRIVAEMFLPSESAEVLQSYMDKYISMWCAANAIGMFQVTESPPPNIEFTRNLAVPMAEKFISLISPQSLKLVS